MIRLAVEIRIHARRDEQLGLGLLVGLPADEVHDLRMVHVQADHLGRAARGAAGLGGAGALVEHLQEGHQARGGAAAGELLVLAAQVGEVGAGARAVLEHARFLLQQLEDGHQVVVHPLDEARGALRVLVGILQHQRRLRRLVPVPIAGAALHPVRLPQAAVEPHGRVERPPLGDQQQGQLVLEDLGVVMGLEVAVLLPIHADRVGDAADHLPYGDLVPGARHAGLAEVLGDHDVRRELRPVLRHLAVVQLEDDLAVGLGDHRAPPGPRHRVQGRSALGGEMALEGEPIAAFGCFAGLLGGAVVDGLLHGAPLCSAR